MSKRLGGIVIEGLAAWAVSILVDVPNILDEERSEVVHKRLFPRPSGDTILSRDWERLVHPDLFHLMASSQEIVEQDLQALEEEEEGEESTWRVRIPEGHVHGWIGALNATRLTLAESHSIGQEEMESDPGELSLERGRAVARIHVLGWIQQLLVESEFPEEA